MPLEGKLGYRDIADLLRVVDVRQKSGVLRIRWEARNAKLFFSRGELFRAESSQYSARIGDVLVGQGVLERDDIDRALSLQTKEGGRRRLGAILHDEFGLSDAEVQHALTAQFKAIAFDVLSWPEGRFEFDFTTPSMIPERYCQSASDFILRVGIEAGLLAHDAQNAVRILLLEPDDGFAEKYLEFLHTDGFEAVRVGNAEEACSLLANGGKRPVLILSVGAQGAASVAAAVKQHGGDTPILAYGPSDAQWRGQELGSLVDAFVARPGESAGSGFEAFIRLVQGAVSTLLED
jgi:hypothetical protein